VISGTVTANREAVLCLTIFNTNNQAHEINAIIDTGFNGNLTLPSDLISALELNWLRLARAILADGSEIISSVYEASVLWDGQPITISVSEANADPLVGMSLMYGYELVMPIVDGATFTLRSIADP
jgi:clan AA aspartic protease